MKYKFLALLSIAGLTSLANTVGINVSQVDTYNTSDASRVRTLILTSTRKGTSLPMSIAHFRRLKTLVIAGHPMDLSHLPTTVTTVACDNCTNIPSHVEVLGHEQWEHRLR
jgi:hypothetical protein